MRRLLHSKANALQAIYDLTQSIGEKLELVREEDVFDAIRATLKERQTRMDEIDALDKRIRFLEDSGYIPPRDDDRAFIEMEQSTIRALLEKINAVERQNTLVAEAFSEEVSDALKLVQDERKTFVAYVPPPSDDEGLVLDTLR